MVSFLNRVLLALVVVLIFFGALAGINFFLTRSQAQDTDTYIYLEYDGVSYGGEDSTAVITIPCIETVTFTIGNTGSWGDYSVEDCIVRIVPNLDDDHNFEFIADGSVRSSVYSSVKDLTAAFSADGGSIEISSSGEFSILFSSFYMADILGAVYGYTVKTYGDYYLYDYPYIAIELTSPDGADTLTIPLLADSNNVIVTDLEFDVESIILL